MPNSPSKVTDNDSKRIAAIDLGSNSFHMLLAETSDHGLKVFHREKRQVALAKGLQDDLTLTSQSIDLALQTLKVFSDILEQFRPDIVRIVGTYTFRTASNIHQLTKKAQAFLHHPIEIMSGTEEARLIFQGVSHNNVLNNNHLIVDIGGGSTEMIIGMGHTPLQLHSCDVGCVSLSDHFFSDGNISEKAFKKAIIFAEQQLDPIKKRYRKTGWEISLGTSGTIKAIASHIAAQGDPDTPITLQRLNEIKIKLLHTKTISNIELPGVNEDRYGVICGGLAVLIAVFRVMKIKQMTYCDHALREGLVAEVEDRIHLTDIRDFSVSQLCKRFNTDIEQAFRVERDALELFDSSSTTWRLGNTERNLLRWACQLHEIGHILNFQKANQHAHYIVKNASLAGFNQEQQEVLAFILLSQRKNLKTEALPELSSHKKSNIYKLTLLLRLGILLNRFRQEDEPLPFHSQFNAYGIQLTFDEVWPGSSELLNAELEKEQRRFKKVSLELDFNHNFSEITQK